MIIMMYHESIITTRGGMNMKNNQYNEYDYFIDRLAELVIEYYTSTKANNEKEEKDAC